MSHEDYICGRLLFKRSFVDPILRLYHTGRKRLEHIPVRNGPWTTCHIKRIHFLNTFYHINIRCRVFLALYINSTGIVQDSCERPEQARRTQKNDIQAYRLARRLWFT